MPLPGGLAGVGFGLGLGVAAGLFVDGVVRLVGVEVVLDGVLGGITFFRGGSGLDT